MKKLIKSQNTWPCIKELIGFLEKSRNNQTTIELRIGINHSIIFHSACYIEGIMEQILKTLLSRRRKLYNKIDMPEFDIRKTTNTLFNALEEELETRISRSTGIKSYLAIIKLLTGNDISHNSEVQKCLEGINVLFQFRNMIAHGREITATRLSAGWISDPWEEIFVGGYKHAEEYLVKIGLLDCVFMDSTKLDLFFTDAIADHFWVLARNFISVTIQSLEYQDKKVVIKSLSEGMRIL